MVTIDVVNAAFPCAFAACSGTVRTVTLSWAYLYYGSIATNMSGGNVSLFFSLNNPGSRTYISSLALSGEGVTTVSTYYNGTRLQTVGNGTDIEYVPGSGINLTISQWDNNSNPSTPSNTVTFGPGAADVALLSEKPTSFDFYAVYSLSQRIKVGQVFQFIINFQNGQSVSGSLIAG